ncbi:MAG: Nif11-like leader peptide family natural product precursor [Clostridiales bacterium]|nr:Nif11-like leader peptide family natural product precursor [Clostridiales bacterium]
MTANMKNFLAKVSEDKGLAEKIGKLEKVDELIAAAKAIGIELTEADFAQPEDALNDQELTAVTGGEKCLCVAAGGGTKDDDSKACGCVAAGAGYHDNGDQRCFCVMGGSGDSEYAIN